MNEFKLVSHVLCPYVQRSIIVMKEKGIAYTRVDIDLANKPAWFIQASPTGKVPVLLTESKQPLFESGVICEYLDEVSLGSLHPADSFEKARHRAWIEFGSGILASIAGLYSAKDKTGFYLKHEEIQQKFQLVENEMMAENEISTGPFFSGQSFHIIDAVYGPIFRYFDVFEGFVELNTFANFPKCQAWRDALKQRVSVQQSVSPDYPAQLTAFLAKRESYIAKLVG